MVTTAADRPLSDSLLARHVPSASTFPDVRVGYSEAFVQRFKSKHWWQIDLFTAATVAVQSVK